MPFYDQNTIIGRMLITDNAGTPTEIGVARLGTNPVFPNTLGGIDARNQSNVHFLSVAGGGTSAADASGGGAGGLRTSWGAFTGGGAVAESTLTMPARFQVVVGNVGEDSAIINRDTSVDIIRCAAGGNGVTTGGGVSGGSGSGAHAFSSNLSTNSNNGGSGTTGQGFAGGNSSIRRGTGFAGGGGEHSSFTWTVTGTVTVTRIAANGGSPSISITASGNSRTYSPPAETAFAADVTSVGQTFTVNFSRTFTVTGRGNDLWASGGDGIDGFPAPSGRFQAP